MIRIAELRSRVRVEVPEFSRCCFCLPLRHGLLLWGYFKMVSLLMFAYLMIEDLIRILKYKSYSVPAMLVLFLCLVMVDMIVNAMFLIAGHMKHQKLFKMYYYYSIGFLVVFVIGYIIVLGTFFYTYQGMSSMLLWFFVDTMYVAVPVVMVQIYVTLLVRSESRKLEHNSSNFEFVNNTAEASGNLGLNNIENAAEVQ